jgi:hypothetical protein
MRYPVAHWITHWIKGSTQSEDDQILANDTHQANIRPWTSRSLIKERGDVPVWVGARSRLWSTATAQEVKHQT